MLSFQAKHNTVTHTYQNEVYRAKAVNDLFDEHAGTLGHFKITLGLFETACETAKKAL